MAKYLAHLPSGRLVTAEAYNALLDYVKELTNIKCGPGIEVRQNAGGKFISLVHHPLNVINQTAGTDPPGGGTTGDQFFARITEVLPTATTTRWTYIARRLKKNVQGETSSTWEVEASYASHEAFNLYECINSEEGVQGNGVDIDGDDFPESMAVMPVPIGSIVRVFTVVAEDTTLEWWFAHCNAIDGTCD